MRLAVLALLLSGCAPSEPLVIRAAAPCAEMTPPRRPWPAWSRDVRWTGGELVSCDGEYPFEHCQRLDGGWL